MILDLYINVKKVTHIQRTYAEFVHASEQVCYHSKN